MAHDCDERKLNDNYSVFFCYCFGGIGILSLNVKPHEYVFWDTGFPMALQKPYISGSNFLLVVTGCLCSSSLQLSL